MDIGRGGRGEADAHSGALAWLLILALVLLSPLVYDAACLLGRLCRGTGG